MVTTRPAGKRSATCWDLSKQQKLQFARRPWSHNYTKCMGADVEKPQIPPVSRYFSSTHLTSGHKTSAWWRNEWTSLQAYARMCFSKQGQMPWHIHFPLPLWITYSVIPLPVFLLYLCSLVSAIEHNQWVRSHYDGKRAPLKCCMRFYCTYALPYRVFKAYMLSISCHYVWSSESV